VQSHHLQGALRTEAWNIRTSILKPPFTFFYVLLKIQVHFKNGFSSAKTLLKSQFAYLAELFNENKSKSN
jgi:hypothetical protein